MGRGGDHICKTLWDERSNKSEEKEAKVFEQVTNSYVRTTVSEVARMKRRHTVANSTYVQATHYNKNQCGKTQTINKQNRRENPEIDANISVVIFQFSGEMLLDQVAIQL